MTAKLFQNGQSQAVRLPKEFRFENQEEVLVKKVDGMVVLISKDNHTAWDTMFKNLDEFSDDFMDARVQPTQKREDLF